MPSLKKISRRRAVTAKEAARRFGKSPRTIRRLVAEDRQDYLSRSATRREAAYTLRQQGKSWPDIAKALDCSEMAARGLEWRYRQIHQPENAT